MNQESTQKKHVDIRVYGKVQETGYRFSAMQAAYRYGVFGIVQYVPDGSVYIEAEGAAENLDLFVSWCQRGPSWARVKNVLVEEGAVLSYTAFDIIRNNLVRQTENIPGAGESLAISA
ncbi:MAG: acylphosphatase [Bacteroidetes bacterium]|nr:acylphosphatase [Bacteroidota bacterium]